MAEGVPVESMVQGAVVVDQAFWQAAAEARVRDFCGWHVAPIIESDVYLDGRGGEKLLLPSGRLLEVLEVTSDGVDVTDRVRMSREVGAIELVDGSWSKRYSGIRARFRHGYSPAEVPQIVSIIAALTQRSIEGNRIAVQEAVSSASTTWATEGGVPLGSQLMQREKSDLLPFRIHWTTA